jgi:RNA polymerase sigma-70 factor, ECF subfamily
MEGMTATPPQPLERFSTGGDDKGLQPQASLRADRPAEDRQVVAAVVRAKAGDQEAIRYLYCRYADNVQGYVRSIVRDHHDAEDVTQDVFAKLSHSIVKYEPRQVPFSAWIFRVARNAALDHLRRQRSTPVAEVWSSSGDETGSWPEASDALSKALGELSPEQREVVGLRHVVGLTPSEIAERTGRTESSVHGLHHRGRSVMRRVLAAAGAAPCTVAGG